MYGIVFLLKNTDSLYNAPPILISTILSSLIAFIPRDMLKLKECHSLTFSFFKLIFFLEFHPQVLYLHHHHTPLSPPALLMSPRLPLKWLTSLLFYIYNLMTFSVLGRHLGLDNLLGRLFLEKTESFFLSIY